MIVTQRIEIDPTEKQKKVFEIYFGYKRYCYNRALGLAKKQIELWKNDKKQYPYPSSMTLRRLSREAQNDWEGLRSTQVHDTAVDDASVALSKIKGKGTLKMPKFKTKRDTKQSCRFYRKCPRSFYLFENENGKQKIYLPTFSSEYGTVKMKENIRQIFMQGDDIIKQVGITRRAGKYFATFFIELMRDPHWKVKASNNSYCGVDLGVKTFATITDDKGNTFTQDGIPKKLKRLYDKSDYYRRLLSFKQETKKDKIGMRSKIIKVNHIPDSKRYLKTRLKLQRNEMRITNIGHEMVHEVTSFLCKNYKVITIEDLSVRNLLKNKKLSKVLKRSLFYEFRRQMEDKCKAHGNTLVIADKFYPSSQTCSHCGHVKTKKDGDKLKGTQRIYRCPKCGLKLDRDVNASINLRELGKQQSGLKLA